MKLTLRIHFCMQKTILKHKGKTHATLRAKFKLFGPFLQQPTLKSSFSHLFQLFFILFTFFLHFFLFLRILLFSFSNPCPSTSFGTQNFPSPTLSFLHNVDQKEFPLSHALLSFKNKGMDSPTLG